MMSQPEERGWWGRNWKWAVPAGCLAPLILCGGGLAGFVALLFGMLKSSEPYKEALAQGAGERRG